MRAVNRRRLFSQQSPRALRTVRTCWYRCTVTAAFSASPATRQLRESIAHDRCKYCNETMRYNYGGLYTSVGPQQELHWGPPQVLPRTGSFANICRTGRVSFSLVEPASVNSPDSMRASRFWPGFGRGTNPNSFCSPSVDWGDCAKVIGDGRAGACRPGASGARAQGTRCMPPRVCGSRCCCMVLS